MSKAIDEYTPNFPKRQWKPIASFVREAVRDCESRTPYAARTLLIASSRHVRWCTQTAGFKLDRAVIFHRGVIADYIGRGCPQMSRSSAGNRRSQLLRMSELLLPPNQQLVVAMPAMPPPTPVAPYTPSEVIALKSWASGQASDYLRLSCHALLALGLGAGLSAAEVGDVQARHLHVDDDGVMVEVVGARARIVPVLAAWEPTLRSIAGAAMTKDLFVFRPRRVRAHRNLVGNFIYKTNIDRVRPNLQRMRVTWVVTHLVAGTPVKALVAAAGVESLEALTRYLVHVPELGRDEYRTSLRAAGYPDGPQ